MAFLVLDGAVVQDVEQLVTLRRVADLGHKDLDLVGLHLVGEDLAERLRIGVRERPRGDVLPRVRVPLQVGVPHARDLEHLELVVLADARERDVVVDLADLEQRARRVLRHDHDAVRGFERDEAPAAGDAFPRVVGAVLHDLLRRHVEGHRHSPAPSSGPPSSAVARRATSSSGRERYPSASITATVGKMRRTRSGPPVAVSSSAAANSDRTARSIVSSARHPLAPRRLDPVLGVHAAGTVDLEVGFLVLPAGGVVAEHAAAPAALVEAGEEWHDDETLHCGGKVGADHLGELVGLALERQRLALDLLVVLELGLEQADHVDAGTGDAGDGDAREVVGGKYLLDPPVGDRVAAGGTPVAGQHDAVGEPDCDDRRAVRDVSRSVLRARRRRRPRVGGAVRRRSSANEGPGSKPGPNRGSGRSFIDERAYTGEISANAAEQSPEPQSSSQPPHRALVVDALEHVGRRQVRRSRADGNGRDRLSRPLPSALTSAEGLPRHDQSLRRPPPQRESPLASNPLRSRALRAMLAIRRHVTGSTLEQVGIVAEQTKRVVAAHAQETADLARPMVVIDVQRDPRSRLAFTECAHTIL